MLAALPIAWRIHATTLLAVLGMISIATLAVLETTREQETGRRAVLQHVVESAAAIAGAYHAEEVAGRMPRAQAQAAAVQAMRAIRYRGEEYVWVNDMTPRMVMHPFRPDLEGKEIGAIADPNGFRLFEAFVATVKRDGSGVVPYLWPRPGSASAVEKMSFVQGFAPWGWVIGSGLYVDDLRAEQRATLLHDAGMVLLGVVTMVGLATLVANGIVRPLRQVTGATARLAGGELEAEVPAQARRDEIGVLARALDGFRQDGIAKRRLEAEARAERAARDRRQAAMERHTADFGGSVSGVMRMLTESAEAIRETAGTVAMAGRGTRDAAEVSSQGARESTESLTQVAAATEELSASVGEIARQVAGAADAAARAVNRADATSERIRSLTEAAAQIGNVVQLIQDVAGRTNLLALNATIEAARAGEAGKGFAVVAAEVKQLAEQTRRATEEISRQVGGIQAATGEAVAAVAEVGQAIGHVNGIAAAIAAAVEQQGAATREIAGQVNGVAGRTVAVRDAMGSLHDMAEDSMRAGDAVLSSAEEVARVAETLKSEVDLFLASAQDAGTDRRRQERVLGLDLPCVLLLPGNAARPVRLVDVARGGAGLRVAGAHALMPGIGLAVQLPGETNPVQARVARVAGETVAVVFRQDAEAMTLVERVLARLEQPEAA
jgi:methyl-accepting chemotaxis protein